MKRFVSLTVFPVGSTSDQKSLLTQVPLDVFEQISALYPDGREKRSFRMSLPVEDERAVGVRKLIVGSGFSETGPKFGHTGGKAVVVTYDDKYEQGDFGRHDWYEIHPKKSLADYPSRNAQGYLQNLGDCNYSLSEAEKDAVLAKGEDPPKRVPKWAFGAIASVGSSAIVMGKDVADGITASGFNVPVKPTDSSGVVEWSPGVIFQPLSPSCIFCDPKGNALAVDANRACGFIVDGHVQSPVLKYDRTLMDRFLATIANVDVARTKECFGNAPGVAEPIVMVSRRLAQWLLARDEKLIWKPVEIL